MPHLWKTILAIMVAALCATAYAADKRASFGFATSTRTSGFVLNPTLEQVTISRVAPGSAAEKAGLLVGDVIISANEKPIPGSSAKSMASLMRSFGPGDHLRLEVDRAGKATTIDIVAGER